MDLKKLKKIINLMQDADISEIELEEDDKKIRIVRNKEVPAVQTLIQPMQSPHAGHVVGAATQVATDQNAEEDDDMARVTSPMVGTFYVSSTPDAPAYVRVGDIVKKGDVVCIIEAMKLMNEIESEVDGKVVSVLVKNAQPVEYGQALYLIDPQ